MISTFSDKAKAKAMNEPTKKADGLKENEIEIPILKKILSDKKSLFIRKLHPPTNRRIYSRSKYHAEIEVTVKKISLDKLDL